MVYNANSKKSAAALANHTHTKRNHLCRHNFNFQHSTFRFLKEYLTAINRGNWRFWECIALHFLRFFHCVSTSLLVNGSSTILLRVTRPTFQNRGRMWLNTAKATKNNKQPRQIYKKQTRIESWVAGSAQCCHECIERQNEGCVAFVFKEKDGQCFMRSRTVTWYAGQEGLVVGFVGDACKLHVFWVMQLLCYFLFLETGSSSCGIICFTLIWFQPRRVIMTPKLVVLNLCADVGQQFRNMHNN